MREYCSRAVQEKYSRVNIVLAQGENFRDSPYTAKPAVYTLEDLESSYMKDAPDRREVFNDKEHEVIRILCN
jgi:hypothetical protein